MVKIYVLRWSILIALGIAGCSVELSPVSTATAPPGISTDSPMSSADDINTSSTRMTQVPMTWAGLDLTGRLVYIASSFDGGSALRIQALHLTTGEIETLFTKADSGWVFYVTISPDAEQLVMSYIPPAQPGASSSRGLYVMPLDASTPPRPLFPPPTVDDQYVQAEWSPDGQYIYFAHYNHKDEPVGQSYPAYDLLRMKYPDGQPEKIVDHAFWPRVSPDSTKLVYVSIDPDSGRNDLYIANPDGSNPQRIDLSGPWIPEVIDAPLFAPDGQSVLFSAPAPQRAYQPNWLENLLGIQMARAHNVPSDWWSVPVAGGAPTRLTQIQTINLFASLSPDERHIASVSGEGLFVMDLDGSNLTRLLFEPGISGTVSWIP